MACKYSNDIVCSKEHSKCSECSCQRAIDGYLKQNSAEKLPSTEYSYEFDRLRQNRVNMSQYKYGSAKQNFGERLVDARGCIDLCLKKFDETHNTEFLTDAANYCMFRYMYPQNGEFFKATDSGESAGIDGMSYKEIQNYGRV